MGIRQPSRTATFFKQAQAGAEAQKEARETLKKPQALGEAAAAGTQMVAATTGAQQQATQQVKTAGADTTAKVGAGIATVAPTATSTVYAGTKAPTGSTPREADGAIDTVAEVDTTATNIKNDIKATTDQINAINAQIATANTADAKLLQEKKVELEKILQDAQDKITKENLGQIAGPSTFETEMAQREKLLAEEGGNIAKLRAIFGPRFDSTKYGALSSQIYGKDLEAIQEEAAAGLEEKARTEERADVAEKEYKEGIASGKLKVAEKLKSEQAKLDFLKKTPEELSAYSKDELKKIFGFEDDNQINKLFNFDASTGKSTGSKLTATQLALANRNKELADSLAKNELERPKALAREEKEFEKVKGEAFGTPDKTGSIDNNINYLNNKLQAAEKQLNRINSTPEWRRARGDSKRAAEARTAADVLRKGVAELNKLKKDAETAVSEKNKTKLLELQNKIRDQYTNLEREVRKINTQKGF